MISKEISAKFSLYDAMVGVNNIEDFDTEAKLLSFFFFTNSQTNCLKNPQINDISIVSIKYSLFDHITLARKFFLAHQNATVK
jgi:hypothetical protein